MFAYDDVNKIEFPNDSNALKNNFPDHKNVHSSDNEKD